MATVANKWTGGDATLDDAIPPEIARLTQASYQTFEESDESDNLITRQRSEDIYDPHYNEKSRLKTIKTSISTLRPYIVKKVRELSQVVEILEIFPSGESAYKISMSLEKLLSTIHAIVVKNDTATIRQGDSSPNLSESDTPGESPRVPPPLVSLHHNSSFSAEFVRSSTNRMTRELNLHDLRHLENQFNPHEQPTVLVRRHAVLLSLNPLKAIIMADKLILIVPNGADSLLYLLGEHMHDIVENNNEPMTDNYGHELGFYKAMLATTLALHTQEYATVLVKADKILVRLKKIKTVTMDMQESIRVLKNKVSSQQLNVDSYRRLLHSLLSSEDDLALLNLSLLKRSPHLYRKPLNMEILESNGEIAVLVEAYLMDYNTLASKLQFITHKIQTAEELVHFRLDTVRNDLLVADTTLDILMVCLAAATLITSMFGMNLYSGVEDYQMSVFWIFCGLLILISSLMVYAFLFFYKYYGILPTNNE